MNYCTVLLIICCLVGFKPTNILVAAVVYVLVNFALDLTLGMLFTPIDDEVEDE